MPIAKFPAPAPHRLAVHNVIVPHTRQYWRRCVPLLAEKNHTTAGGNEDYKIHVYLVATRALLNERDLGWHLREITFYLLLQDNHHSAVTTSLFCAS